jgi:hypothetical protein
VSNCWVNLQNLGQPHGEFYLKGVGAVDPVVSLHRSNVALNDRGRRRIERKGGSDEISWCFHICRSGRGLGHRLADASVGAVGANTAARLLVVSVA